MNRSKKSSSLLSILGGWRLHLAAALPLSLLATLLCVAPAQAGTFNPPDLVDVGDAGNDPSKSTPGSHGMAFGSVDYEYKIGKYEVTNDQYVEFLNAVDPTGVNTKGLYDIQMNIKSYGGIMPGYSVKTGHSGRPVNYVDWYDAVRYVNWLNNGMGNGDTETGSYTLTGINTDIDPGQGITRNAGARWVLPTDDEWYKAAYYDPTSGDTGSLAGTNYWDYPTQSNTKPTAVSPAGNSNSANYGNVIGKTTLVGAYSDSDSHYGTFDQAGNVYEWTETGSGGAGTRDFRRHIWGGSWSSDKGGNSMHSHKAGNCIRGDAWGGYLSEVRNNGFRVAYVPEPSAGLLCGLSSLLLLGWRRRRDA